MSGKIRVIDGDTFVVGDTKVRLFGIDALESGQTCQRANGQSWACGSWISREVRARYQGRIAACRQEATDVFGRVVATCFVDGRDVGQALVRDGLAVAFRKYSMRYDLDEKSAVVAGKGMHAWAAQRPAAFRAGQRAKAAAKLRATDAEHADCPIKGNISASGRIYHLPGQEHYDRTGIDESKGERWFCSEAEAAEAGWRKARR